MLTQTAEHALRAVIYLARQPEDSPVPADRIAAALDAPANYLSKTLRVLARNGLLRSVRGVGGGFWLAEPADAITLQRLAGLFEEPRPQRACLLGDRPCTDRSPCAAHEQWLEIRSRASEALRTTTVSDLLSGDRPMRSTRPIRKER